MELSNNSVFKVKPDTLFGITLQFLAIGLALVGCMEPSDPLKDQSLGPPNSAGIFANESILGLTTSKPSFSDMQVAGGLTNPTMMTISPDGRIFVNEQDGKVRVIKNGTLLETPFVTLNVNSLGERGTLGITLDPAFNSNHFVYVYYTTSSLPHNRVSRFTANGDVAAPGETILMDLPVLSSATNHNGGALNFGLDGKLYIAVGDNANADHSQNMGTVFGKTLRINADGSIPTDNPFYGTASGKNRALFALGLRNPYTMAIHPTTGRMILNDVGQYTWEEINDGLIGANYGWPATEGITTDSRYKSPLYAYDHSSGSCSIIGGAFYNPILVTFPPEYVGNYFFGDYCAGWIKRIDSRTGTTFDFASGVGAISHIQVGNDGAVYYIDRTSGSVHKISYTNGQAPTISLDPVGKTVTLGENAGFTVGAAGTQPFTFKWQRNQVDIAASTAASFTWGNAQLPDNGSRFRCIVSNSFGSDTSTEALLTVSANRLPTASITSPTVGSKFRAGQTIGIAGIGVDAEDGNLPSSGFTWEVKLFHDDGSSHSHPFFGPTSGAKSGNLAIPAEGETSPNIWFRIYLTVRDSKGFPGRDSLDVHQQTVSITLGSNPSGLQITLDGQPHTTPYTFTGVVGATRWIGAASPQQMGTKSWSFLSWPDGKPASHSVTTPANNILYTVTFAITGSLSF